MTNFEFNIFEQKIEAKELLERLAKENPQNALVVLWDGEGNISFHSNERDHKVVHYYSSLFSCKLINGDFYDV